VLPHRDVRRAHEFTTDLAAIDADVRRTDEALRYVEELLAKLPTAGVPARTAPGIWIAPLVFSVDGITVEVNVGYTFDDEVVELLSATRVPIVPR
jgi:hypothetical protein